VLEIKLLGPLSLAADGEPLDLPTRRHGQLLLGYLALNPGLHARSNLAGLLWPDVLESSARSSLRSTLSSVRRALGPHADRHLVVRRDRIGLADSGRVSVDLREFQAVVDEGRLEAAAACGRGILLQGLDDDWIEQARQAHRRALGEVLAELASAAEARDDLTLAVRFTREQVELDPLAEPPNRELIRRLAAAGDRASALAAYASLSEAFRTQLHTAPSPQTRQLAAGIRACDDGGRDDITWTPLPLQTELRLQVPAALLGRAAELAELRAAMTRAASGERQVVLVGGEPGMGKTALLAHFAEAMADDVTVLYGRCRASSVVALAPFVEALRHYAGNAPSERILREIPAVASQLLGLVPELGDGALQPPAASSDMQLGESGRVARILVETLLALCRERPLVLIADDLHEADPATLRVLAHLIAASEQTNLLLVIGYRDTEAPRLSTTLRALRRMEATRAVVLSALGERETGEVVALATGQKPSDDFVRAVHRHSVGNPLFAQELSRWARATGGEAALEGPDLVDSPLPERVSDVIHDELSSLAPATRRALATASALGDEFDLATLTGAIGETADDTLDALDEAVAFKAIRELPDSVGRFQFRHPLIRETLYATLTATRRAHLHLRIAEVLEARDAGDEPAQARQVAEHLARARDLAPRSKLAEYTVRAARAAEAELAHDDAAVLYERAAALAEGDSRDVGLERCRLLIALGHARRRAGQTDGIRDAFREAAELARDLPEPELLAQAALGICAAPDFTAEQALDGVAVDLLNEALASLGPRHDALRARLLAQLAGEQYFSADRETVEALVAESQDLARATDDPLALGAALDAAHMIRRGGGDPRERLVLADEMLELARSRQDAEHVALAHVRRAADLFELGDLSGVQAEREAVEVLARELRQPAYLWWTTLWRATRAIFEGSPEGEQLAMSAYAAGRAAFGEAAELELRAQMSWLRLEQGRFAEGGQKTYAALERYKGLPAVRCGLARMDAEMGRLDAASEALEQLTGADFDRLRREAGWPLSASLLAEVCARVRDAGAGARLEAAIAPGADRWAVSAFGSVCFGPLSASLALVCAVAGRHDDAERHRLDALAKCSAAGAVPAAARLEREYGLLGRAPAAVR
jgi:DNA-binding SARP family transcriptional activator